ncbi:MAG: pyroglutamyl-peptidase I [Spirochaetes bacterium]|nr:pyroglutamyl-peptidase I [Spirochaetota bacterium]
MKVLVTGFEPFGGDKINPAYEAVKLLPAQVAGADVLKEELPTVYGKCANVLEAAVQRHAPDIVICVGQAGGRSVISIEKVAINLAEARIPDNDGQQPSDKPVIEGGPAAYFSSLPVKAMVKKIKERGIPSSVSYSAGTFVCNDIMYRLLHMIERKYPGMRGGFIHVPFEVSQVTDRPDGTPSMSVQTIAAGLECAIEAAVTHEQDIQGAAGETH